MKIYVGIHKGTWLIISLCTVLSCSVVSDSATPWTVTHEACGLPCPPPGDLPYPGIKPTSPALQADSLPLAPHGKPKVQTAKKMIRGQVMLPHSMDAGAGSTGRERTGCTDVFPKSILLLSVQRWRPAQSETTSV